jgi:hypothetical protein
MLAPGGHSGAAVTWDGNGSPTVNVGAPQSVTGRGNSTEPVEMIADSKGSVMETLPVSTASRELWKNSAWVSLTTTAWKTICPFVGHCIRSLLLTVTMDGPGINGP